MPLTENLRLDAGRIKRRIHFLEQRAEFHLQSARESSEFQIACAAALWRDAAALALLIGDGAGARQFLLKAGGLFARIGIFLGYALMSVAEPNSWQKDRSLELSTLLEILREGGRSDGAGGPTDIEQADQPRSEPIQQVFRSTSLGATRQLMHLYQAFSASSGKDDMSAAFIDLLEHRLRVNGARPIGPTGLPVQAYMRLLRASRTGEFSSDARETLSAVAGLRAEQLQAAQLDRFHWRLALTPTDIIDFDLLAVAAVAWEAGKAFENAERPFKLRGEGVDAPFRALAGLRDAPSTSGVS